MVSNSNTKSPDGDGLMFLTTLNFKRDRFVLLVGQEFYYSPRHISYWCVVDWYYICNLVGTRMVLFHLISKVVISLPGAVSTPADAWDTLYSSCGVLRRKETSFDGFS